MLELIKKDFILQRKSYWMYAVMSVFILCYFTFMNQKSIVGLMLPALIMSYSILNRSMYQDEQNHALRWLVSLPLSRKKIVHAKYVWALTLFFATQIAFLTLGFAMDYINFGTKEKTQLFLLQYLPLNSIFLMFICVYLPICFRLGYIRAATVNRNVFLAFYLIGFAIGFAGVKIAHATRGWFSPGFKDRVIDAANRLASIPPFFWAFLGILLAAGVIAYSIRLSERWFERRELF